MANLTHLTLRVDEGYLRGSSLKYLSGWDRLEKLELYFLNPINATDLAPIRTLTGLKSLRLVLSPEDNSALDFLKGLDNLWLVDFRQTVATDG